MKGSVHVPEGYIYIYIYGDLGLQVEGNLEYLHQAPRVARDNVKGTQRPEV
jgi:hypothetical protein